MSRTQALAAFALTLAVSATLTNDAFAQSCPTPSTYEVTDLGTLGGNDSAALDINAAGQIVGASTAADGSRQPFLYENGHMVSLGTFGGPVWTVSGAAGINASGQVAGQSHNASVERRAFLWSGGLLQDLGVTNGAATALNDSADVVGWVRQRQLQACLAVPQRIRDRSRHAWRLGERRQRHQQLRPDRGLVLHR